MSRSARALVWPGLATLLVGGILVSLGIWQLHRLSWKEAILTRIADRIHASPSPLPAPDAWAALRPVDYEYRHVTVSGIFQNDRESLVFRSMESGPGYLVMTPLRLDDGGTVIVNRGFVPLELKDPTTRKASEPTGRVTISGLMRESEPRNIFTPADDPAKGQYFTRDPSEIAARQGLRDAAPFTIDEDRADTPGGWPRGGTTAIDIPNNHFSYALTWFGLALGLVWVFGSYAKKQLSHSDPEGSLSHDQLPQT